MTLSPLPRWRYVICTECSTLLFRLRLPAGPESAEVRRYAGAAFEQAQLAHWQRCAGVVFTAVDVVTPDVHIEGDPA